MKLIKREEIKWDIVRKTNPIYLLGCPVFFYYSKWGVNKNTPFISKAAYDQPTCRIKMPWGPKDSTNLRACVNVVWSGWLWFWRANETL